VIVPAAVPSVDEIAGKLAVDLANLDRTIAVLTQERHKRLAEIETVKRYRKEA
jgi:hypothetical protein